MKNFYCPRLILNKHAVTVGKSNLSISHFCDVFDKIFLLLIRFRHTIGYEKGCTFLWNEIFLFSFPLIYYTRNTRKSFYTCKVRHYMGKIKQKKGVIAILTGGGDVPGLNPAIRSVTIRAIREGYKVIGIRRGWAGLVEMIRDKKADNSNNFQVLTEEIVNRAGRTGGTFLHSSRTRPSHVPKINVPVHLKDNYSSEINDLTTEVIKNLDFIGADYLIPIGGDDTLSYAVRLFQEGIKLVAIPKTMDNDVPGTDYCIGFSTCVTRTIMLTNSLRTTAGSHERLLIIEVFGRYAGFTAMLPTMAGAANRCVIPEYEFEIELLAELLVHDRNRNPSKYAVVLVSEGAKFTGGEMIFEDMSTDAYGHKKLGGIGDLVSVNLKDMSAQYNNGKRVNVINQKLGYVVRCGDPDAIDSIVPMAYGNLALDLIMSGVHGRLVVLKNGRYDNMPIDVVTSTKKLVEVNEHYNTERLRPQYESFGTKPLFIMTSE
jgi:6-phosphofructokinase 1